MTKPVIQVTKPYLPNREKLDRYIDGIYERNWLTNNGPLVQELTQRLQDYLGVENLLLVANGTLALQIAHRTLAIHEPVNNQPAEAITTPFTFVATASSLKWEGIQPVFVDIDPDTWNLDPKLIETAITPQTRALVPVHVFGNPCEVEAIQAIADKHQLKIIYDAAHAFGVKYKGESILNWGDAATLSFHATKVFHTIEGGAIVFKRKEDLEKAKKLINFGITGPESIEGLGINGKMNEFQAAMGLCVLDEIEENIRRREIIWNIYQSELNGKVEFQQFSSTATKNFGYAPVVMGNEEQRTNAQNYFTEQCITARRYFFPTLDSVSCFASSKKNDHAKNISNKILCLPLHCNLSISEAKEISLIIQKSKNVR